ncbi:hypothetical protein QBC38DRAFT_151687 [Podospora fimiseda]|uniref:Uncharacterized protein n=1 Tax=Podospora fimiseda TaxID=252190 RepID=A0AAN7BT72_9PEZI|nr:hypothetical protein QBC38DRAFT_151687 [Podospora fimiseda]
MHPSFITFLSLLFTLSTSALPLNINLGAYSPALVVGDGEISFAEGGEGVTGIIDSLEGAAVSGAAKHAARQVSESEEEAAPILNDPTASLPFPGETPSRSQLPPRDLSGFDRALTYAEAALTKGPAIQLGTGGEGGSGVGIIVDNNAGTGGVTSGETSPKKEDPERGIVIVAPGPERE